MRRPAPVRRLLAGVLAAGAALVVLAVPAGPADAQPPSPTASPDASASPTPPPASVTVPLAPTEADPESAADLPPSPSPTTSEGASPAAPDATAGESGAADGPGTAGGEHAGVVGAAPSTADAEDVIDQIAADDTPDDHAGMLHWLLEGSEDLQSMPWRHYDLGASVQNVERLFTNLARLIFAVGLWVMAFALWLLEFVLRFDLGRLLAPSAGNVAAGYAENLDSDLGAAVVRLVLIATMAHALWQAARNRGAAAAAELLVAAVIAAVAAYLITHAEEAGCQGLQVMATTTIAMMELAEGDDANLGPTADICEEEVPRAGDEKDLPAHQKELFSTFVHEPFLLLQWGEIPKAPCDGVAEALVLAGAWGDDDKPRGYMEQAGCQSLAEFNRKMTAERVAGTAAWTVATTAFAVAIVLTAGTLLAAQVAGALLVAVMPFAVVLGVAPGAGRQLLVRWVHGVLKVGVMFVGSGFFLTLMTTAVGAVQGGEGDEIFVRMLSSVVVAWALVILRGRVFQSMRRAAATTAQGLAPGLDVGGPGRGPGSWAAGKAVDAATTVALVHQGAVGAVAGATLARQGGAVASSMAGHGLNAARGRAAQGIAAVGRAARLRRGGAP